MAEHGDRRCPDTGKACFSRKLAEARARNARRRRDERVSAYVCRRCGWWHIGHRSREDSRRGGRRR